MSKKLIINYERVIIEAKNQDNGYCYIGYNDEGNTHISIDGNMTLENIKQDYPLCLYSEEEIDEFATKLKKILKHKNN